MTPIKCRECSGIVKRVRKNYHYKECGLESVMLAGIQVNVCSNCQSEEPEIPSIASLHRLIMLDLLKKTSLLCGEEIRFLRKMARLKATDLARHIDADATSISKWENNERTHSGTADRVIRLVCYTAMLEKILRPGPEEQLTGTVARAALAHDDLNVLDLMRKIEGKSKGPKKVSIDMGNAIGCGVGIDAEAVAGIH